MTVHFRTENPVRLPVCAPGSAGMAACFVNLVNLGDKVGVRINRALDTGMREKAIRPGATPVPVPWGRALDA